VQAGTQILTYRQPFRVSRSGAGVWGAVALHEGEGFRRDAPTALRPPEARRCPGGRPTGFPSGVRPMGGCVKPLARVQGCGSPVKPCACQGANQSPHRRCKTRCRAARRKEGGPTAR
jgi:hypothetical protein